MNRLDNESLAEICFEVLWESSEALHREHFLAPRVNMWRDIFPRGMKDALLGLEKGQEIEMEFGPGDALPGRKDQDIVRTGARDFMNREFMGREIVPGVGRFYPRGLLGAAHFFPQDMRPCRLLFRDNSSLVADCAHPLADKKLRVKARLEDMAVKDCETGGRVNHWMEVILGTGPGMQARIPGTATEFVSSQSFERADQSDDGLFYSSPRFVEHIDSRAGNFLGREYCRSIKPGMRILDLMASVTSHLPQSLEAKVVGLGLTALEMDANPRLDAYTVHDLNRCPVLPYQDESFDAVLCSLSVEYLIHPVAIAAEVSRVLRPNGVFLVGFSSRWFPPKVTRLWQELHEFERVGFVLDLLLHTGAFKDLESLSIRNWYRPADDPHIQKTWISDPVYVVRGKIS